MSDQQWARVFGGPEIQDIAVGHAVYAADLFLKAPQYPKLHLFLAFIPEANQGFVERGDFRSHVTHHVQGGIQLHLQPGKHAQAKDYIEM